MLATPAGVRRAFKKLDELKSEHRLVESGAQPLQLLASGEVAMTSAYNGRITGINRHEGKKFKVVFPGSIYAVDSWVVLKGAENKAAAWISSPSQPKAENQAKLPEYVAYGLPNKEAGKGPGAIAGTCRRRRPTSKARVALNVDFWIDNAETLTSASTPGSPSSGPAGLSRSARRAVREGTPEPDPEEHRASDASRRMAAGDGREGASFGLQAVALCGRRFAPQDEVRELGSMVFMETGHSRKPTEGVLGHPGIRIDQVSKSFGPLRVVKNLRSISSAANSSACSAPPARARPRC